MGGLVCVGGWLGGLVGVGACVGGSVGGCWLVKACSLLPSRFGANVHFLLCVYRFLNLNVDEKLTHTDICQRFNQHLFICNKNLLSTLFICTRPGTNCLTKRTS
jgi:hypothetical protein